VTLLDLCDLPAPSKPRRVDLVAAYFRARPGQWIDGLELAKVGGAYAWRTRVSECRKFFGMAIENDETRQDDGSVRSLYRFVP